MKVKFKTLAVISCAALCALSFTACSGKSIELGKPADAQPLNYTDYTESFTAFKEKTENFAARLSASVYEGYEENKNFALSPVSVFMALSLAAECANGDTRAEILSALGVSYEELSANVSTLYRSLVYEAKNKSGILDVTNSIWVNEGTSVKQGCINTLSDTFYSYSYAADFLNDNQSANRAVRSFVKDKTRGVIDSDYQLPPNTLFTIINTLYLKTLWNNYGRNLPFTDSEYTFTAKDGSTTSKKLLQGYYYGGKVHEKETYSTFYTATTGGFELKFILPKDGYTVNDVFTAENIATVNAIKDYGGYDEENRIAYETRCFFPEYKCSYNGDLAPVLSNKLGINILFSDDCDFTTLTDAPCYCSEIKHMTNLVVDKKGIEGASVVYIPGAGAGEPIETVYADFIIDRAFGFIITDSHGTSLFSGVVQNI